MRPNKVLAILASLLALLVAACQPTVYLMPTPEAFGSGEHDPFSANPELEPDTRSYIAYATNRMPVGPQGDRFYLTLFDDNVRLGIAQVRIGEENLSWEELHAISTSHERKDTIPLSLEYADERATVRHENESEELSPEGLAFFEQLNAAIARSLDPDLTLYVHGANNNFYRASAQASQFSHFTGRNSVVMLYAWPSAESLLKYAVDVNNARETVPVFARLLELLARHSNARQIDILAYSAGAQVVSPALAYLREKHPKDTKGRLKKQLRLGEVYFAAPDLHFSSFLEDMASYIDLPSHVTLALNPHDSVLAFSAMHHGVSRAGSPDTNELTEEETQSVRDALRQIPFDLIWIDPNTLPGMSKGSHDFWYSHPWVSTDVLMQLLFHARPAERGLEAYEEEKNITIWHFPADYQQRITPAIEGLRKAAPKNDR